MLDGGHASVDNGSDFGIVPPLFIKGWAIIWSRVGLFDASKTRIFVIRFLLYSDIITCSGN